MVGSQFGGWTWEENGCLSRRGFGVKKPEVLEGVNLGVVSVCLLPSCCLQVAAPRSCSLGVEGWDPVRAGQHPVLCTDKFSWGLSASVELEVFTPHMVGFSVYTYTHTPKIRVMNLSSQTQIPGL